MRVGDNNSSLLINGRKFISWNNKRMGILKIKRIYEPATPNDGVRILVDRLWSRGITKERANLDLWLKEVAPSTDLRKWFNHEPQKFKEFAQKYKCELNYNVEDIQKIKTLLRTQNVTLVYAAKSPTINHARVLKEYIEEKL